MRPASGGSDDLRRRSSLSSTNERAGGERLQREGGRRIGWGKDLARTICEHYVPWINAPCAMPHARTRDACLLVAMQRCSDASRGGRGGRVACSCSM